MERRQFLLGMALTGPLVSLRAWAAPSTPKLETHLQKLPAPGLLDVDLHGPRVALGCGLSKASGSVLLLERQSGKELWSIAIRGLRDCRFCDQARLLFVVTPDGWSMWDTLGYKPKAQVRIGNQAAGVSRDGQVVVICQGSTVKIYDQRGKLRDTFAGDKVVGNYDRLTLSPDGNYFALWNKTGFFLYDVGKRASFGENTGSVAFHPDGGALVRQSPDGWLVALAIETGAGLAQPVCSHTGGEVAFSPNGKFVLSQGQNEEGRHLAQVWSFPKLEKVCSHLFSGPLGAARSALSVDGKQGMSWAPSGQVEIWDATSGTSRCEALKLPDSLRQVAGGDRWLVGVGGLAGKGFYCGYRW